LFKPSSCLAFGFDPNFIQHKRSEALKVRRIRNHNTTSNNPALMFAAGVEQIINDKLSHPSQYDDQELHNLQNSINKQAPRVNPFKILFRQLTY
jgi:hypothetical protein